MTADRDEDDLMALFGAARADTARPSEGLLDRIMADADMVLAGAAPVAPVPRRSLGAVLLAVLGGWGGVSGLAAATMAGLWIGVAPPASLDGLTQLVWGGTVEVPLMETAGFIGLEG